jgi:hypothetical protein
MIVHFFFFFRRQSKASHGASVLRAISVLLSTYVSLVRTNMLSSQWLLVDSLFNFHFPLVVHFPLSTSDHFV